MLVRSLLSFGVAGRPCESISIGSVGANTGVDSRPSLASSYEKAFISLGQSGPTPALADVLLWPLPLRRRFFNWSSRDPNRR